MKHYSVGDKVNNHKVTKVEMSVRVVRSFKRNKVWNKKEQRVTAECITCGYSATRWGREMRKLSCKRGPCSKLWQDLKGHVIGDLTVIEAVKVGAYDGSAGSKWKWKCLCKCGREELISLSSLTHGKVRCTHCRYARHSAITKLPDNLGNRHKLIQQYKRNAKKRGFEWSLSFEEAEDIMSRNCIYCNEPPHADNAGIIRNSIDRVDNTQGYTISNTEASCFPCNRMKHTLTADEYIKHITAVYNFNNKRSETSPKGCTPK